MSMPQLPGGIAEAVERLEGAAGAKKCWPCGCLHGGPSAIERAWPKTERPAPVRLDSGFRRNDG